MRIVLATLLAVGAAGFSVVPAPTSFLVGPLPVLAAFLVGWVKLALDLVDLVAADLLADVAVPIAVGLVIWRGGAGDTWLAAGPLVVAAVLQALPAIRRARSPTPHGT
jgi:hypothetical protein